MATWPRALLFLIVGALALSAASAPRSSSARAEFVRENPCPATGKQRGPCPGWNVEHTIPLKCGGADHKSNMTWMTVEEHKRKTKREARLCRNRHQSATACDTLRPIWPSS